MYDPLSMPQELLKAHAALDKAFDVAHSYKNSNDDTERETFLFELRQQITSLLSTTPVKKTRKNVVV